LVNSKLIDPSEEPTDPDTDMDIRMSK